MTGRNRSTLPEADDLSAVPFIDDEERAESEWLLKRENEPAALAPSSKIANDYVELENLLGSLPTGLPDEQWTDEVLRLAAGSSKPRPPWRRPAVGWGIGGALVAAAAVMLVVMLLVIPRGPELEVEVRRLDEMRRDPNEVVVGDHLIVRARPPAPGELRVYRSADTLVARCPDGPQCTGAAHGEYTIEIALDAPVQYHVLLVVGATAPSLGETMDAYMNAARAANARIITHEPIDVH
jgi:hypothetical protein